MNTLTNLNTFPIGNSLDGINIITEEIEGSALLVDGSNYMLADLNMNNNAIKNLDAGVDNLDAVNKGQLDVKADTSYVNTQLALKADKTYVDTQLATKADTIYVNTQLALKADKTYVDTNFVNLTGNQTIGGTKTFSNQVIFNGATKTNLTANDIPNAGTRQWLLTSAQTMTGIKTFQNGISLNSQKITNLAIGTADTDAVNFSQLKLKADKTYVDSSLNLLKAYVDSQDVSDRTYVDASLNLLRTYVDTQDTALKTYTDSSLNTLKTYVNNQDNLKVNKAGDTITGNLIVDGKVGIGTTNPTEKLEVNGNCFIEGSVSSSVAFLGANSNKQVNITNNNHGIWFNPRFTSGSYNPLVPTGGKGMIFSDGTKETGELVIGPWSDGYKGIKIIGSSGNVGIGTSPTETLDVDGNIKLSGTIKRSTWSSGELMKTQIYGSSVSSELQIVNADGWKEVKTLNFTCDANTNLSDTKLFITFYTSYFVGGYETDRILSKISDTTGTEQVIQTTHQYYVNQNGGGTRSGTIFPIMGQYTPANNTTTKARVIKIYAKVDNAGDTLYVFNNGGQPSGNSWHAEVKQVKT